MTKDSQKSQDIEETLEKVEDFWSTHNVGTRVMLLTFAFSYAAIVVASFIGIVIPQPIVDMVWYSALIGFMTVTLGANGLQMVLTNIVKIKSSQFKYQSKESK